jgi:hypothetical protein
MFLSPQNNPEFFSPSPAYLPSLTFPGDLESKGRFMYEGRHRDRHPRSLFLADYEGKTVLVRFCEQYSEVCHKNPAVVGFAPTLYYVSDG